MLVAGQTQFNQLLVEAVELAVPYRLLGGLQEILGRHVGKLRDLVLGQKLAEVVKLDVERSDELLYVLGGRVLPVELPTGDVARVTLAVGLGPDGSLENMVGLPLAARESDFGPAGLLAASDEIGEVVGSAKDFGAAPNTNAYSTNERAFASAIWPEDEIEARTRFDRNCSSIRHEVVHSDCFDGPQLEHPAAKAWEDEKKLHGTARLHSLDFLPLVTRRCISITIDHHQRERGSLLRF